MKTEMWREPPRVRPLLCKVGLSRFPRTGGDMPPGVRASVLGSTGLSGYPRTAGDVPTDVRALVVGLSASQGLHARAAAAARRQSPGRRRTKSAEKVTKSARAKRTDKISDEASVLQGDPRGVTGRPGRARGASLGSETPVWAGV